MIETLFNAVHVNDCAYITVEHEVENAHGVRPRKIHLVVLKLLPQSSQGPLKSCDLKLFLVICSSLCNHKFGKRFSSGLKCELVPSNKLLIIVSFDVIDKELFDDREGLLQVLYDVFYLVV